MLISEGREGKGWRSCVLKLRKVSTFFESSFGARHRGLYARKFHGDFQSFDMGDPFSVRGKKTSVVMVGGRSYA